MISIIERVFSRIWLPPVLTVLFFLTLGPSPEVISEWYPQSPEFHLQMLAFEQGKLSLADHPAGASHDWSWGNGLQQPWGLGTPALQYPFFKLARLFGADLVPEAPIYLFWLALTAFTLNWAFRTREVPATQANILTLVFLSHPILFIMLRQRYAVYETAIAYGVLCGGLSFAFLIAGTSRAWRKHAWVGALIMGFFSFVRPTAAIYPLVSACVLALTTITGESRLRRAGLVGLAFAPGPLLHLWTNQLRFGSLLESGHQLVTSGNVVIDYPIRLANHMFTQSWPATLAEATGLLFSNTVIDGSFGDFLGRTPYFPGQLEVIRLRELSFSAYSAASLILVAAGALLLLARWVPTKTRQLLRTTPIETLALAWGLVNFTGLFLFYSHSPVYCARYAVDFVPALAAIASGLALFAFRWLNGPRTPFPAVSEPARTAFALLLVAGFIVLGTWTGEYWTLPRGPAFLAREEFAEKISRVQRNLASKYAPIPRQYDCGTAYPDFGLMYNFDGWHSASCQLGPMTTLYLPSARCLEMDLEILPEGLADRNLNEVRVKRGLEFLRPEPQNENELAQMRQLKFCGTGQFNPYHVELISIAWVSPSKFALGQRPLMRLKSLRVLD